MRGYMAGGALAVMLYADKLYTNKKRRKRNDSQNKAAVAILIFDKDYPIDCSKG